MTGRACLITGATGLFAPYMADAAAGLGPVATTSRSGGDIRCDLTEAASVADLIAKARPEIVIHTAGMTDVDACERDPEAARHTNRGCALRLAELLPAGSRLVFISTDQVYPDTAGPHEEGSEAPVNAYGASKLAGEREVAAHPLGLSLRTNFFGPSRTPGRASLSDFVHDNLAAGRPITLFRDVLYSPLHMRTLAGLVVAAIEADLTGVYNLGSRDGMNKADFGLAVARRHGLATDLATIGTSSALPDRAPRASDLRLDVGRIEGALGRPMPTLEEEIAKL